MGRRKVLQHLDRSEILLQEGRGDARGYGGGQGSTRVIKISRKLRDANGVIQIPDASRRCRRGIATVAHRRRAAGVFLCQYRQAETHPNGKKMALTRTRRCWHCLRFDGAGTRRLCRNSAPAFFYGVRGRMGSLAESLGRKWVSKGRPVLEIRPVTYEMWRAVRSSRYGHAREGMGAEIAPSITHGTREDQTT